MTETIRLNKLSPAKRCQRKRLGRGIGSGTGKTAGRGHKGQRARSGGRRDSRHEGGQMPLQRRLPKRGFNSRLARQTKEIRLSVLERLPVETVTVAVLREHGVISHDILRAKVFNSGKITRAVTISGIAVTGGARAAIEAVGGKVTE